MFDMYQLKIMNLTLRNRNYLKKIIRYNFRKLNDGTRALLLYAQEHVGIWATTLIDIYGDNPNRTYG